MPRGSSLLLLVALAACGSPPGRADAGAPPPPPRARLATDVTRLHLGAQALRLGDAKWVSGVVEVRNDGEPGSQLDVTASGPGVCVGSVDGGACAPAAQPWRLSAGEATQVPVAVNVDRLGAVERVLHLDAADAGAADVTLAALGTEAEDCLVASPALVDFPPFPRGCPVATRPLRLANQCLTPRVLRDRQVVPDTEPFAVQAAPSFPRRLEPGATLDLVVEFTGGPVGVHQASLLFTHDLGVLPVGVRGERVDQTPPSDTFVQPWTDLDVLVVLDSSPSFTSSRSAARQAVTTSLTSLSWWAGPLEAGVIGTGEADLVPGPDGGTRFTWPTAGFQQTFGAAMDAVSYTGSETEACIATAAQVALDGGFFRPTATHVAVCVTDADEQSADPFAAAAVLAQHEVRWSVLGPPSAPPVGCYVESTDGGLHEQLTAALGGQFRSVCALPQGLPPLGFAFTAPPARFALSFPARLPLRVEVDGQVLPTGDYAYEATTNEVVFRQPPPPGSTITIWSALSCP